MATIELPVAAMIPDTVSVSVDRFGGVRKKFVSNLLQLDQCWVAGLEYYHLSASSTSAPAHPHPWLLT